MGCAGLCGWLVVRWLFGAVTMSNALTTTKQSDTEQHPAGSSELREQASQTSTGAYLQGQRVFLTDRK